MIKYLTIKNHKGEEKRYIVRLNSVKPYIQIGDYKIPCLSGVIGTWGLRVNKNNKIYTAIESYITYDLDGGVLSTKNPEYYSAESEDIVLNNPTKEGYEFLGWTGSNGNEAQKTVTIQKGSFGDKKFVANWGEPLDKEYTITYVLNGGSNIEDYNPSYYTKLDDTITISEAIKENCDFLGWTTEDSSELVYNPVIPKGSTGNKTFIANFITYDDIGKKEPGLYDVNWNLKSTWSQLIESKDIIVNDGVFSLNKDTSNLSNLSKRLEGKLIISSEVTSLADPKITIYSHYFIYFPDTITRIPDRLLFHCEYLRGVRLPKNLTFLGQYAFSTTRLMQINIPSTVTSIGQAFISATNYIRSIKFPASLSSPSTGMLCGLQGLESITVDSNNKKFDSRDNCNAVINTSSNTLIAGCGTTIIPNTVKTVSGRAFYNCQDLKSLYIPASVISFTYSAIYNCVLLESITVDPNNTVYDSRENCNAIIETATNKLVRGGSKSIVPTGVTSLGNEVFNHIHYLTSLVLPNTVKSIGNNCFNYCYRLSCLVISDGVTSIPKSSFYGCHSLSVFVPSSVVTIEDKTFDSVYCVYYSGEATGAPWGAKQVKPWVDPSTVELLQPLTFKFIGNEYIGNTFLSKISKITIYYPDGSYATDFSILFQPGTFYDFYCYAGGKIDWILVSNTSVHYTYNIPSDVSNVPEVSNLYFDDNTMPQFNHKKTTGFWHNVTPA